MSRRLIYLLVFIAVVAALMLRLPRLSYRPMHTDEAVHGIKFGDLLEEGTYRYDSYEYHGPTLNYFTLIPASLSSAKTLVEVDESILRIVPVFFGVCLVLVPLLLKAGIGLPAACFAMILTAVSPAMVFYSRYYIQEILLVFFTAAVIACGFRYWRCKKVWWLVLAGLFAGLMHATKETCLIAFCAMASAAILSIVWSKIQADGADLTERRIRLWHIAAGLLASVCVSVIFFSSFFSNPQGIVDSVTTYATYFDRAGNNVKHVHPWFYYFKWLMFWKTKTGPIWTEATIVLLAAVGFIHAMTKAKGDERRKGFLRFIAFYTVLMVVVYSAIPYKTPWCLLGFLHGMILLAAVGAIRLLDFATGRAGRTVVMIVLTAIVVHLGFQAYLAANKYASSWRNPWVYSHPQEDIYDVVRSIEQAGRASDEGLDTLVRVICAENDYWPLPWYLRAFSRVGYHREIDDAMSVTPIVIIAAETDDGQIEKLDDQLCEFLYTTPAPGEKNLYVPLFRDYREIRPLVEVRAYIWKSLDDKIARAKD